ncbi:bifunctional lysylphosphatidylglycerol flippase/synthetase MprF [Corynebacterium uberis]|uniref:bifunctional lysylphosphatidylglycerol flippase/synthetase MprF n=1 Tax=Corynebacterium TaxID=1716 RepID=UPI001D09A9A1|nr:MULTISPECIES: DUF2156 domain-containing protein [Corynebacterium]MCZ9309070.1 DUF2156 domain-containing protein [Corynebacterium sp. c6VSa_13]UDL74465.1 DUF2156 domain-containing protein [Corynebacterium uberis]UDL76700.1 DUF2156 domain-containing protein [Corynebacterium uberis]UDL78913.1 DUF2156 domain-containing protein [Corynebacterium uberis]UDL83329.1 DUF2156 domain-containing protein [Corynebacterium uberis]
MTRQLFAVVRRTPATFVLAAMIWIVRWTVGPDTFDLWDSLGVWMPYRINDPHLLLAGLTASTGMGAIISTGAILVLVLGSEMVLGTRKMLAVAAAMQIFATPVGLMIAQSVEEVGLNRWGADLLNQAFVSPVGWICGTAAFATGHMPVLWRRRIAGWLVTLTATLVLFSGSLGDFVGLATTILGLLARNVNSVRRMSLRETRVLVAMVLAAVGLGPVISAFNPLAQSPLSAVGELAWWPAVIDLVPLIVQAVLILGLVRGRRLAWWLSLGFQILSCLVIAVHVVARREAYDGSVIYQANILSSLSPWLACIAVLVVTRRAFQVRIALARVGRFVLRSAAAFGATSGLWFVGAWLLRRQFAPHATMDMIISQWLTRYVPPAVRVYPQWPLRPDSTAAWLLYEWVGSLFWIAVAVALYVLLMSVPDRAVAADRMVARQIMAAGSGDHLQAMTVWPGNRYWFNEARDGYVAFRVRNGVAVTVGQPVGSAAVEELAAGFEKFAAAQGWTVAWYSVNADFARDRAAHGFKRVQVAEESLMLTECTDFKGKKFQNVRTARNRAVKEGVEAVWTTWAEAGPALRDKITALSEEWVADKALPEMGFTLGTLDELAEPGTRLLLAIDGQGRVHGVTSWLPVYEHGQLAGLTLDFMRRDREGFRPVIEFLLAEAAVAAREEGLEWVSLSGAPLARSSEAKSFLDQALDRVGHTMEPFYGFRTLAASKYKFNPTHEPWYLVYRDELTLPAIAIAVSGCYLPQFGIGLLLNRVPAS